MCPTLIESPNAKTKGQIFLKEKEHKQEDLGSPENWSREEGATANICYLFNPLSHRIIFAPFYKGGNLALKTFLVIYPKPCR